MVMILPLAFAAIASAAAAPPFDTARVDGEASRVWIEGGSNVADWSCKAVRFDASVDNGRVIVRLSVRDLKCGNRKMDHDLYAALKASDPAAPSFIVALFDARPGDTRGTLEVAGVERTVTAQITTELAPDGTTRARGNVPILMTDFGVKPPVGLFGLIRSKNEVVVKFELIIP
jgi:polyisoprenoid-binding protein YceI